MSLRQSQKQKERAMYIIMLSGGSLCGKTTTLNKVYDSINPTNENIIKAKSRLGGNPNDFECIIKYNGQSIAFYTMGDYSCYLLESFEKYDKENCDILICACNDRFKKPYKRINKYSHLIINKKLSISKKLTDLNFANNHDKEKILKELKRISTNR